MNTISRCLLSRLLLATALCILPAACKSMPKPHWPWTAKPAAMEPLANQVAFEVPAGAMAIELPQHWRRNTLVIDLSGVSGSGSVAMRSKASAGWPVRLALRIRPGTVGSVEVTADQRMVLPVSAAAGAVTVDVALSPSLYTAKTPLITLSWSSATP